MSNRIFSRAVLRVLCAVLILAGVMEILPLISSPGAYAGTASVNFDTTDVLEDLQSSTVNDKSFDLLFYPYDPTGLRKPEILNFVEYCYTYKINMQKNYGLYIYFYNPQGVELDTANAGNKLQLAVKYNQADGKTPAQVVTADSVPVDYEQFDLKFCSVSGGNYKNLFYKFKVVDHESADGKTILKRVNSNGRRYDVSGAYLAKKGAANADPYQIAGSYLFTGYAAGYGSDAGADSTLISTVNELETLELNVQHTYWRDGNKASDSQNQLDSVYFSVPDSVLDKYGKLQMVKCVWYEYKTQSIIITQSNELYEELLPRVGENIGTNDTSVKFGLCTNYDMNSGLDFSTSRCGWGYNMHTTFGASEVVPALYYMFNTNGTPITDYVLRGETLQSYILNYTASTNSGYLPIKNGKVSADLFLDDIDAARKAQGFVKGFNTFTVDSDNKFNMLAKDDRNWWNRFWDKNSPVGSTFRDVCPVEIVPNGTLQSNTVFVNQSDLQAVESYREAAKVKRDENGNLVPETTFLIRFAVSEYLAEQLYTQWFHEVPLLPLQSGYITSLTKHPTYKAQETVYLDFNVIQLTFNRDGDYHVIPVVSNPLDAIGGITAPPNFETGCNAINWKAVLGLVLLVILFVILWPVLLPLLGVIFKSVLWVVCLPFRLIIWPFKKISETKKKNKG